MHVSRSCFPTLATTLGRGLIGCKGGPARQGAWTGRGRLDGPGVARFRYLPPYVMIRAPRFPARGLSMRLVKAFACAVMLICLGGALNVGALAAPASEVVCRGDGTRVALLIGNQDYVGAMQALANPRRDT